MTAVAKLPLTRKVNKMPKQQSTRKVNKMPHNNESDLKFLRKMKIFKARHPNITVKPPRSQKPRKNPPPYMNKKFWKSKAKAKIFQMNLQFHQQIENNQYTDWTELREHLRKIFRNKEMNINITMI